MTQQQHRQNVQAALDAFFSAEPPPTVQEAYQFLVKLRRDIDLMLVAIELKASAQ